MNKHEKIEPEDKTFKEILQGGNIDKEIKKHGDSLGINFSKEELKLFGIEYGDIIRLNNAGIIKRKNLNIS